MSAIDPIVPSGSGPSPEDESPPIFRTWAGFYAFVLILHAVIITLFYFFTQAYA